MKGGGRGRGQGGRRGGGGGGGNGEGVTSGRSLRLDSRHGNPSQADTPIHKVWPNYLCPI